MPANIEYVEDVSANKPAERYYEIEIGTGGLQCIQFQNYYTFALTIKQATPGNRGQQHGWGAL